MTQSSPSDTFLTPRFCLWCSALFGMFAILKGFRLPNGWAVTQIFIDYSQGFVKRGFEGAIYHFLGFQSYRALAIASTAQTVILICLLVSLTVRSRIAHQTGNPLLVTAFFANFTLTFMAHINGYLDVTLFVLAISLLLIKNSKVRLLTAVPVCLLAMLVHESFLLTAFPAVLFSFFADEREKNRKAVWFLLASVVTAALFLAVRPSLSTVQIQNLKLQLVQHSDFAVRPDVLDVLGRSMHGNIGLVKNLVVHKIFWWVLTAVALVSFGPVIWLMCRSARGCTTGSRRWMYFVCSLAPLSMNVLGWDNMRWAALCTLAAYLNLCTLHRSVGPQPAASRFDLRAAFVVLGIGLASGYGLMDQQIINPYPFFVPLFQPAVIKHDGNALGRALGPDYWSLRYLTP